MVVKEPHEMSESIKNYPAIRWTLPGLRPLQVGLILAVMATSLAGVLSNPLFTLANDSVTRTPLLQQSSAKQAVLTMRKTSEIASASVVVK